MGTTCSRRKEDDTTIEDIFKTDDQNKIIEYFENHRELINHQIYVRFGA